MLDVQRYRHSPKLENVQFTRKILWALLTVLILVGGCLTFHGLFIHALATLLVLMITVLLIVGMGNAKEWCRCALAFMSLGFGVACALLARFGPEIFESSEAPLGVKLIPIWAGLAAIACITIAACFVFSEKVQYSSRRLFTLW